MQIEHKTEKGTILFVKVPDDASDLTYPKVGMIDLYFQTKEQSKFEEDNYISIGLPDVGFKLIGPTSEVTEEQARMMVKKWAIGKKSAYENYADWMGKPFNFALDSFKSLMQHLKITDEKWIVLFKPNDSDNKSSRI